MLGLAAETSLWGSPLSSLVCSQPKRKQDFHKILPSGMLKILVFIQDMLAAYRVAIYPWHLELPGSVQHTQAMLLRPYSPLSHLSPQKHAHTHTEVHTHQNFGSPHLVSMAVSIAATFLDCSRPVLPGKDRIQEWIFPGLHRHEEACGNTLQLGGSKLAWIVIGLCAHQRSCLCSGCWASLTLHAHWGTGLQCAEVICVWFIVGCLFVNNYISTSCLKS